MDRALDFSGSRTKIQWVTHEASVQHAPGLSGVGGGASDFLGKSWGILEPVAKFWESSAGNSGKIWDSDGIVREQGVAGTTRQEAGKDHKKGGSQTICADGHDHYNSQVPGRFRPLVNGPEEFPMTHPVPVTHIYVGMYIQLSVLIDRRPITALRKIIFTPRSLGYATCSESYL